MNRLVQPEWLDTLPPADPRAVRSRRDLRRINAWMRNHNLMADALQHQLIQGAPKTLVELGAGDGGFLLQVAQQIAPAWPGVQAALLDRQPTVPAPTLAAFEKSGWQAKTLVADVFDWPPAASDVVIANMFLHHFEAARLRELLGLVAARTKVFVAIEPRRAAWPHFCSRLLWAIACNDVTRHDAVVSVRAGFNGQELSVLWPAPVGWKLDERPVGPFSHLFIARKIY
jgi:hypothetical protein